MARKYRFVWQWPYSSDVWFTLLSKQSPLNRGMLPRERPTEHWCRNYPHYPDFPYFTGCIFRHPHSMNEKRQYAASLIDDEAPLVRGKRKPINLADAYWDINRHMDRCWKTKKVRKQWMINI